MKGTSRVFGVLGAVTLGASMMFGLASCSVVSADADGWRTPELSEPLPRFTASSQLPFDAYRLSDAERTQIDVGYVKMLDECMASYGVKAEFSSDYIQQKPYANDPPFAFAWGGKLGTLGKDQASEYGYIAPPGAPWNNGGVGNYNSSILNVHPSDAKDAAEDAKIWAVLAGPEFVMAGVEEGDQLQLPDEQVPRNAVGEVPPKNGCGGTLYEKIGVDVERIDITIVGDVKSLTREDSRVKKVTSEWSSCMKKQGYTFRDVVEPVEVHSGAVNPENIAVAVADVKCTEASRWPDTYYAVLADYQRQAIAKDPALFDAAIASERKLLDRLNELGY